MLWMWKHKADACGRLAKIRGETPCPFLCVHKAGAQRSETPLPGPGLSLKWAASNQGTRDDLVIYLLPKGSFILDEDVLWEAT